MIPKVESPEEVRAIGAMVEILEVERGLEKGHIGFSVAVETAKGFMNMAAIAQSSTRNRSLALGTEDFLRDIRVDLSMGDELLFPKMQTVIVARATGLQPRGLVGSFANYKDIEGLRAVARKSFKMGFVGASCIHPDQVAVLKSAFAGDQEAVERARQIVAAYEEAVAKGSGAISVDGVMVDVPVAERALQIVRRHQSIQALEAETRLRIENARARDGKNHA